MTHTERGTTTAVIDAYDQRLISEARKLADANIDELAALLPSAVYGDDPDSGTIMAFAFGIACSMLRELAGTYERALNQATAVSTDDRQLDKIRAVFADFNWELDDRQYALEKIERIALGGSE